MKSAVVTRRGLLLGGAAVAAGLVSACGNDSKDKATEAAAGGGSGEVEKVTVLTGAGVQGRETPLFVGIAKGWFKEVGLEVKVLPGKGTNGNLATMASGQATFATLDVSGAMIEFSKPNSKFKNIKLTSVLHQRNLACFVALAGGGITTARDLAGKKISYIPGGINHVLFPTYAQLAGFDPSKVVWVPNPQAQAHAGMLGSGAVQAISQFVPAVESVKRTVGKDIVALPFTDFITDLHGSAIAVTSETAKAKPDMVKRFNQALIKSLVWSLDNPKEAGEIFAKQPEAKPQPATAALAELKGMANYVRGTGTEVGHFDMTRVARNIAILQGAGAIPAGLKPEDIVDPSLAG